MLPYAAVWVVALSALALVGCSDKGCGEVGCDYGTLLHVRRAVGGPFVLGSTITFRIESATSVVESRCTIGRPLQCTRSGTGKFEFFETVPNTSADGGTDLDEIDLRWEDGAYPTHATLTVTIGTATGTKDFTPTPRGASTSACEACPQPSELTAAIAP